MADTIKNCRNCEHLPLTMPPPDECKACGSEKENFKPTQEVLIKGLTVSGLRKILSEVDNQELTVRELRQLLFNIENQATLITASELFILTAAEGKQ